MIQALAEGTRRHIPYRNSVLTRLLQDGLDGNSKTSLIVSKKHYFVRITLHTELAIECSGLRFGAEKILLKRQTSTFVETNFQFVS